MYDLLLAVCFALFGGLCWVDCVVARGLWLVVCWFWALV